MARTGKFLIAILVSSVLFYLAAIWARWELNTIGNGSRYITIGVFVAIALLCAMGGAFSGSIHRVRRVQSRRLHRHLPI